MALPFSRLIHLAMLLGLAAGARAEPEVNTFSIVAFDPRTGDLGVAVQSKYFGVGSVVQWARAGVGAVATQALARVSFGPESLKLLEAGNSAREALEKVTGEDKQRNRRQLGIVDAQGRVAAFTGEGCMAWAGHREGEHFAVQGNLLAGEAVITAMAEAFEKARQDEAVELADALFAALEAGQAAGGDRRGQQSAALLVVRAKGGPGGDNDRFVDLRVDDHAEPIRELGRLLEMHRQFYKRAQRIGK